MFWAKTKEVYGTVASVFAAAFAASFLLLATPAWSQPLGIGADPRQDVSGDVDLGFFPAKDNTWLFFDPAAPGVQELRVRVKEAAWGRKHNVREFDLSKKENIRTLADIQLGRGIRQMAPVELFVGSRHVLGTARIGRFLDGWAAGTEDVEAGIPKPKEPAAPEGAAVDPPDGTKSGAPPEAGGAGTDKPNGEDPIAKPADTVLVTPGTVLVQGAPPRVDTVPPAARSSNGLLDWIKRYKVSSIAILVSIVFFALSMRRGSK